MNMTLKKISVGLLLALLLISVMPLHISADTGWLGSWAKRVEIKIDSSQVDDTLSDFPILLYISSSSGIGSDNVTCIFDELTDNNNRKKIAVTTSTGTTQCYAEIEKWDDVNEEAWIWVKVPHVTSLSDTTFYLYYDVLADNNTAYIGDTNSVPAENVWDSNFKAVYHMADGVDTSSIYDSTSNNYDGAKSLDGNPVEYNSVIALGQSGNGTRSITIGNLGITDNWTMEALALSDTNVPTIQYPLGPVGSSGMFMLYHDDWGFSDASRSVDGSLIVTDTFYYFTVTKSDLTYSLFLNGDPDGSDTLADIDISDLRLFKRPSGWRLFGDIDEVRFSNIARSSEWIKATNESRIDNILTWGTETFAPANPPTDLVLTEVEGSRVDITWTKGGGTLNTEIRRSIGSYPTTRGSGTQVYYGIDSSFTDTASEIGLELDKTVYYYRAWGETGAGSWSTEYDEETTGGSGMVFLGILGFAAIMSFLSFRNTFYGLKIMAGMSWVIVFIYLQGNPPIGIEEGSGLHTALLVVAFGFGLMVVLAGLRTGIKRTEQLNKGLSLTSEKFQWKLPDWMNATQGETQAQSRARQQEETDDYRDQFHRALHQPRRGRRL